MAAVAAMDKRVPASSAELATTKCLLQTTAADLPFTRDALRANNPDPAAAPAALAAMRSDLDATMASPAASTGKHAAVGTETSGPLASLVGRIQALVDATH